mmetsp:Transcript_28345/g.48198  ORF Transcript_28345/g.48198 Transcript_28345/m.48198 type:complete len:442 (+) Transcript_28345:695-2020(+)
MPPLGAQNRSQKKKRVEFRRRRRVGVGLSHHRQGHGRCRRGGGEGEDEEDNAEGVVFGCQGRGTISILVVLLLVGWRWGERSERRTTLLAGDDDTDEQPPATIDPLPRPFRRLHEPQRNHPPPPPRGAAGRGHPKGAVDHRRQQPPRRVRQNGLREHDQEHEPVAAEDAIESRQAAGRRRTTGYRGGGDGDDSYRVRVHLHVLRGPHGRLPRRIPGLQTERRIVGEFAVAVAARRLRSGGGTREREGRAPPENVVQRLPEHQFGVRAEEFGGGAADSVRTADGSERGERGEGCGGSGVPRHGGGRRVRCAERGESREGTGGDEGILATAHDGRGDRRARQWRDLKESLFCGKKRQVSVSVDQRRIETTRRLLLAEMEGMLRGFSGDVGCKLENSSTEQSLYAHTHHFEPKVEGGMKLVGVAVKGLLRLEGLYRIPPARLEF